MLSSTAATQIADNERHQGAPSVMCLKWRQTSRNSSFRRYFGYTVTRYVEGVMHFVAVAAGLDCIEPPLVSHGFSPRKDMEEARNGPVPGRIRSGCRQEVGSNSSQVCPST